jgi:hypothetical protein
MTESRGKNTPMVFRSAVADIDRQVGARYDGQIVVAQKAALGLGDQSKRFMAEN